MSPSDAVRGSTDCQEIICQEEYFYLFKEGVTRSFLSTCIVNSQCLWNQFYKHLVLARVTFAPSFFFVLCVSNCKNISVSFPCPNSHSNRVNTFNTASYDV